MKNTSLGEMFNKFISDMLGILEKDEKKCIKKRFNMMYELL